MEDFFVVTGVPSSQQAASARLSVNIAVRRELFPPGSPRDISWGELKRSFLDIYGHATKEPVDPRIRAGSGRVGASGRK
ncbi:hypothetical protein T06_2366, partial [Trichinella sp. T6]